MGPNHRTAVVGQPILRPLLSIGEGSLLPISGDAPAGSSGSHLMGSARSGAPGIAFSTASRNGPDYRPPPEATGGRNQRSQGQDVRSKRTEKPITSTCARARNMMRALSPENPWRKTPRNTTEHFPGVIAPSVLHPRSSGVHISAACMRASSLSQPWMTPGSILPLTPSSIRHIKNPKARHIPPRPDTHQRQPCALG